VQQLISPVLVERAKSAAERGSDTVVYRAFRRYMTQRGSRLAAAMTYSAFLSIFPLLVVALAVATTLLGKSGVESLNHHIQQQLPGLEGKFSLDDLVSNATAVGVISGVILLWSGLSWVNTARGSIRVIWCVDDMPGSYLSRKALDLVSLVGLGVTLVVVIAASTLTSGFAATVLGWIDVENTSAARFALQVLGVVLSVIAQTVMFAYLLAGIPRLYMPRWVLLRTALRRGGDLRGDEGPGDVLRDRGRREVAVRRVRGADRDPRLVQPHLPDPAGTRRVDRDAYRGRAGQAPLVCCEL
jgi:membrane protein